MAGRPMSGLEASRFARPRARGYSSPVVVFVSVVALVAGACGGSDSSDDAGGTDVAGSVADGSDSVSANGVPELDVLGDLVGDVGEATTVVVDAEASSVDLGDGTSLVVPADAFTETTEVTSRVVALDFEQFVRNGPTGAAYVVSTVDDVDLATPVFLDVPRSPERLRVTQLVDGEWVEVAVEPGDTALIPIQHFSRVPTVVVEDGPGDPQPIGGDPEGETAGAFLTACLFTIAGPTLDNAEYGTAMAFSICTRALISKFTPTGERVSVACVGDRIDAAGSLVAAIDACIAAQDESEEGDDAVGGDETDGDSAAEPTPEATDAPAPTEPAAPVDIGPLGWSGDMTLREGSAMTQLGPATVDITRTAGTNDFVVVFEATSTSVSDFFEIGECTTNINKRYVGEGTFDPEFPNRLLFTGDQVVDWIYPDCGGITENDNTRVGDQFVVQITETGLQGGFEGWEFSLPGVPVPLPG